MGRRTGTHDLGEVSAGAQFRSGVAVNFVFFVLGVVASLLLPLAFLGHETRGGRPARRRRRRDRAAASSALPRAGWRYQTATAMARELERVADGHTAGSWPLLPGPAGPPTDQFPSIATSGSPTVAMTAPAAVRRPGRVTWALMVGLGVVALLAAALWLGDGVPTGQEPSAGAPTSSSPATTAPAPTTPLTQPQASLPAALANLTEVVTSGQQQGTVDNSAAALLRQAQEVTRAVQQGKAEDARKKLEDLQRKTDELIGKGKIRGAAAGRVRQAVTQFSAAVHTG